MQFECEKLWYEDDNESYVKLLIFEVGVEATFVLDITHHDTEDLADGRLREHWHLSVLPKMGERMPFEHDSY